MRLLWIPYFRWLVAHPDETVFYHRFRDASFFPAFDRQRDISYFASFIQTVTAFQTAQPGLAALPPDLLWLHILTTTVMYAKYVAEGVLPTAETEERVFRLLFSGLAGYLAPTEYAKNNRQNAVDIENQ